MGAARKLERMPEETFIEGAPMEWFYRFELFQVDTNGVVRLWGLI